VVRAPELMIRLRNPYLSVAFSHAKIASIFECTNNARRRLSFGATRALPLVVKHVKPIKVTCSWLTNEIGGVSAIPFPRRRVASLRSAVAPMGGNLRPPPQVLPRLVEP